MRLLQFSTSHYCRKVRLALGFKQLTYSVENLTPGLHWLQLQPMTGLTTVPVLLPELAGQPQAIADSSQILQFLETQFPQPALNLPEPALQTQALQLEDWLDESIGVATRFLYYDYRAGAGKALSTSRFSQVLVQVVRQQYRINAATVALAKRRLDLGLLVLSERWQHRPYLVGEQLSLADITAAGLLSPLALIPDYRQTYPWLWERVATIHESCREPLPPGL